MTDETDLDSVREKFKARFCASNEQVDSLLRYWGYTHDVPSTWTEPYRKLMRATKGERGDGTLVAVAEAHLYGWRDAKMAVALENK